MIEKINILERPVIKLSTLKQFLVITVFTALTVVSPWLAHQFNLAGPIFLPMHFFVLLAGLLFGWRAGFLVGLISPSLSYAISGMPVLLLLPVMTLEIAAYGFFAGFIRERFGADSFLSLSLALLLGRVILFFSAWILLVGSPVAYLINAMRLGLPGIALQLALIPILARFITRYIKA